MAPAGLTTRDKVRRATVVLVAMACIVGIIWALGQTVTIDASGEAVERRNDPRDVIESGDPGAIADSPTVPVSTGPRREDLVEELFPAENAEALRQSQIGIDLGPSYMARLVVNGVRIPEDQLQTRPELNQVFFTPGEGLAVESLLPGENTVTAEIYSVLDGREVRQVAWRFQVT